MKIYTPKLHSSAYVSERIASALNEHITRLEELQRELVSAPDLEACAKIDAVLTLRKQQDKALLDYNRFSRLADKLSQQEAEREEEAEREDAHRA